MTKSDDAILEFLNRYEELAVPPMVIAYNVDGLTYPTVQRRIPKLQQNGLVRRFEEPQGYVEITEKGKRYLEGNIDAGELESD